MNLSTTFDRRALPDGAALESWTAPDGWPHRLFAWDPPAGAASRGSLLFQGGRGDIVEKYLEAFHHWHGRGWSIRSFDWRGQGGSGRLAPNPLVGHCDDFGVWVGDLADYVDRWRAATPGPHAIVAHSMGGHLLLRALAEGRVAPDAAVLVAPMLGLRSTPLTPGLAALLSRFMTRIGAPDRPAWKTPTERPGPGFASRRAMLTHSADRYEDELWWKARNPEIALGAPSWRWLSLAYESCRSFERPGAIEGIRTPVLILNAEADRLVDPRATRRIAARLPDGRIRNWGAESAHEILREEDGVREQALDEIDRFLDEKAPRR